MVTPDDITARRPGTIYREAELEKPAVTPMHTRWRVRRRQKADASQRKRSCGVVVLTPVAFGGIRYRGLRVMGGATSAVGSEDMPRHENVREASSWDAEEPWRRQ